MSEHVFFHNIIASEKNNIEGYPKNEIKAIELYFKIQ